MKITLLCEKRNVIQSQRQHRKLHNSETMINKMVANGKIQTKKKKIANQY